jgi:hypothetical protein
MRLPYKIYFGPVRRWATCKTPFLDVPILPRRLIGNRLIQLHLSFHDLGLHRRHDVRHVGPELLHRRFPDRRAVKIGQCL